MPVIPHKALAAVLVAATVAVVPAHDRQTDLRQPPAAAEADGVTLITGDRVVVTGRGYRVQPGPGRRMTYSGQVQDGHLYVIPSDARPLVAANVLDRRLFDVTQLLAWRYGDADRPDVPLIVQSSQGAAPQLLGAERARRLGGLGMSAMSVPKASAGRTWQDLATGAGALTAGSTKLWLDGRRSYSLDRSAEQIGATEAWKQGMTGKGVTVAVLDSGYDPDHPDLKGVVTQEKNFTDDPDIRDNTGHGTHVASIIAGADAKYRGIAPGAKLAVAKAGTAFGLTESAILAGMEWAAGEVKAKIVNLSFGAPDTLDLDPVEQAVNTLSERFGTLFVAAAGNDADAVPSPGSAEAALTVGAVDRQDRIAHFSGSGPREGDHAIKPDITAPGVGILAAKAGGTGADAHVAMSGTSMAAPHVAGAAAILAQLHPDWTGQRLKAALTGSAMPAPGLTPYRQGTGRVDVVRALAQQVVAVPERLWTYFPSDGSGEWVSTGTVTYDNAGDTPADLDLTSDGDVVRLSAQRLQVPAKGQATVTVTIDARDKATGEHLATITARSGATEIRTLAGAFVEPESHNVTVKAIDRDGRPAEAAFAQMYDPRTGATRDVPFTDGTARLRLPRRDWRMYAEIIDHSGTTMAHSLLDLSGDRQVTIDARDGRRADFSVDDPDAAPTDEVDVGLADGAWFYGYAEWSAPGMGTFVVPARAPGLRFMIRNRWESRTRTPTPYVYDLVNTHTDGLPDEPAYAARRADLVKVTATYRSSATAATGIPSFGPRFVAGGSVFMQTLSQGVRLPGILVHYRTPGLVWDSAFQVGTSVVADDGRSLARGSVAEVWNAAVTGPSAPPAGRSGDDVTVPVGDLFADGVAGRRGADDAATGTATLTTGGRTLAETDLAGCATERPGDCVLHATLPPEVATYTLKASARRQVPYSALSTAVEALWTFRSSRTGERRPLPLAAVRLTPAALDDHNRAHPGTRTPLTLTLEHPPRQDSTRVRLETSSDDGRTWHPIPLTRSPKGWLAMVPNPRTTGFISLRTTVTDTPTTRLTLTIARAYAVG
ncbi:S8 family serine peptidase [Nonomuraea sp. NPDC052265]|uniref:S8 family serine peptidase n=1 Tax=Nonomuraea sp. NPDC052265 TaxID=3364374 RepID=UPI0037C89ADC